MKKKITKLVVAGILLMGTSLAWAAATGVEESANYKAMDAEIKAFEEEWNAASNEISMLITNKEYSDVDKDHVVWSNLTKYLNGLAETKKAAVDKINAAENEWREDKTTTKDPNGPDFASIEEVAKFKAMKTANPLSNFWDNTAPKIWQAWVECDINNLTTAIANATAAKTAVGDETWFKDVDPNNVDNVTKAANTAKDKIAEAIAKVDLASLQEDCKTAALNAQTDANAITAAVNKRANEKLVEKYGEAMTDYNAAYTKISEKYEGTEQLRPIQERFVTEYLTKLTSANRNIETALAQDSKEDYNSAKSSSGVYKSIYKTIDDTQKNINTELDNALDELEKLIVEQNNALYDKWVNGTDIKGSYGEVYARYIAAAKKMNEYKAVANQTTDPDDLGEPELALSTIKAQESVLYGPYTKIQQQKTEVLKAKENANSEPSDRTTQYLKELIDSYIIAGEALDTEIDNAVETAKNAVKEIAKELVIRKAIRVEAQNVYLAYNEVSKYNDKVKTQAQNEIDAISISKCTYTTIDENGNKVKVTGPISDIKRSDVSYNTSKGVYLYSGKDEITVDVVDADNYEAIITEITTTVEKSIADAKDKWSRRSDIINAEDKANTAISEKITEVRSYWTYAYALNEGDATKQAELVALRGDIDKLETVYDNAVKENDNPKTNGQAKEEWEKTAIQTIMASTLTGLTNSYNAIYPYADPDAAAKTAAAKAAAEAAVKDLNESITKATEALTTVKEEKKADLQTAIAEAKQKLSNAQALIATAATKLGADGDNDLADARKTAADAKKALDTEIEKATVVDGDFNGDGVVNFDDITAVKAEVDGINVTNAHVGQVIRAYLSR